MNLRLNTYLIPLTQLPDSNLGEHRNKKQKTKYPPPLTLSTLGEDFSTWTFSIHASFYGVSNVLPIMNALLLPMALVTMSAIQ